VLAGVVVVLAIAPRSAARHARPPSLAEADNTSPV